MRHTRDFRELLTAGRCVAFIIGFFACIDRTNAQAEPFEPGIGVSILLQYPDKRRAFGEGFYRIIQVLIGFTAVRYHFPDAGRYDVEVEIVQLADAGGFGV